MQPEGTFLRSRQIVMIAKQQPKVRTHSQVRTYRIALSQKVVPLLYMLLAIGGRMSRKLEAVPALPV